MTAVTEKGNISKELYELVLLIDGQGMREEAWILRCCACLAMNDIKAKVDLIGLSFNDLTFNLDCEEEGLCLSGGQRSWVRRCIEKANKEFVANVAERGEAEPARGEASAIKALVETIKNEEVCQSHFVHSNALSLVFSFCQVRVRVDIHDKVTTIAFESEFMHIIAINH